MLASFNSGLDYIISYYYTTLTIFVKQGMPGHAHTARDQELDFRDFTKISTFFKIVQTSCGR